MKKQFTLLKKALLLLAFYLSVSTTFAQNFSLPLTTGYPIEISYPGGTICEPTSANVNYNAQYYSTNFFGNGYFPEVTANLISTNEATHHLAQARQNFHIIVEVINAGNIPNANNVGIWYKYGEVGGAQSPILLSEFNAVSPTNSSNLRFVLPVKFDLATKNAFVSFVVKDGDLFAGTHMGNWVVMPFTVLGPTTHEVPILGTTVQPQMPYMVLHAPPGDGSYSKFEDTKKTCREFTDTYAEDGSHSANLAVKLGIAGSLGFIATVDFEFSVTMSAGLTVGDMAIKTSSNQTCVEVSEGFETTELSGPNGGGDVFIGYGTDLAYGVYPFLKIEPGACSSTLDTGLIYHPVGEPRRFAWTKSAILDDMTLLASIVADSSNVGAKAANNALNQIDVWTQVLAMNDANINNPGNEVLGTVGFSAGVGNTQSSSISVVETNSIQVEHYIEGTVGVTAVIEVGGSGVTGGYEYKGSKRFGKTQNQTAESAKLVSYHLADDDSGDNFNLQVVRDPMFGTPIFRTQAGTKSSCPHQGGYQRDQPKLKHDGTTNSHITSQNNPIGSAPQFKVDLCNESNEARTYNLKLNALSNLNGAVVSAAGVPLNGNDLGQSFLVPANSCVQDLVVEVKMLNPSSALSYPNLELFLYSPCEEGIQSSVFASVYFGNATSGVDDPTGNIADLAVYPNPAQDVVNIRFDLLESAQVRVELYDMLGRLQMLGLDEKLGTGEQQQQLDLSQMSPGIYMVVIQSENARMTRKLVVNH